MHKRHDPYSSLRVPLFRRYLIASSLVRMGTAAQGLAIGWEVYDRTGQALSLGMVGLVQAIPMLLLTLPAGYLADVFDRRKLMMLSLAGATLASLALAVFSWYADAGPLDVLAALFGLVLPPFRLARPKSHRALIGPGRAL